jgi:hypothetical protein
MRPVIASLVCAAIIVFLGGVSYSSDRPCGKGHEVTPKCRPNAVVKKYRSNPVIAKKCFDKEAVYKAAWDAKAKRKAAYLARKQASAEKAKLKQRVDALYKDGVMYYDTKQYDIAEMAFNDVLALDPRHKEAKRYSTWTKHRLAEAKSDLITCNK